QNLDEVTLGEFLREQNISSLVSDFYLLPMVAAIWSASLQEAEAFPLGFFLRFVENHGLLNVADRPQWATMEGGSSAYIKPLTEGFAERIHNHTKIKAVHRRDHADGAILIEFEDGPSQAFDEVIFACHSDEALALLAQPTAAEQSVLAAIPYQ